MNEQWMDRVRRLSALAASEGQIPRQELGEAFYEIHKRYPEARELELLALGVALATGQPALRIEEPR